MSFYGCGLSFFLKLAIAVNSILTLRKHANTQKKAPAGNAIEKKQIQPSCIMISL